jgi:hypothetical protein
MMLVATLKRALENRYQPEGYARIRDALDNFARVAEGMRLALDDPEDVLRLGVASAALSGDAGSVLLAIRRVRDVLGNPVTSILLVGDGSIIPFWQMTNPVTDRSLDPDPLVASDNPYGTQREEPQEYLAPPLPVGRMLDSPRGQLQDFLDSIDAAKASRINRTARSGAAAVVNADWAEISALAAATLPQPVEWHLSPGYQMVPSDAGRKYLYFNLHGFPDEAEWKGYSVPRGQYVTAVTPGSFQAEHVSGSIVFAENCYGAAVAGKTVRNSCALSLVKAGAAFVGATGLAFGSHLAPRVYLEDADYLGRSFFGALTEPGTSLGTALVKARQAYLSEGTPWMNPFKQKTLLQFVLFGDPGWN